MDANRSLDADRIKEFNYSLPLVDGDDSVIIGPKKRSKLSIVVKPFKSK